VDMAVGCAPCSDAFWLGVILSWGANRLIW
jgi:hypothetical protein